MSPRPKKPRHCDCPHSLPEGRLFKPAGTPTHDLERIELALDEFEAVRLCDYEGCSQEEAGLRMGISRGTVQRLVVSGRRKLVDAIINSHALVVQGADGVA